MGAVKGNACVDQPNGFGSVGGKMEKLWVRSQDRSKLQLVDSFEIKENKDGTYSINDLGNFSTKEKAIDVLGTIVCRIGTQVPMYKDSVFEIPHDEVVD